MKLNELIKTTEKPKKRRGQGYGSSKGGHTSGRGQKGQTARGTMPIWFEGGQLPQIRRFPFIRGKGRFNSLNITTVEINVGQLNKLKSGSVVDVKSLIAAKLVRESELESQTVKILGRGELTVPLTVVLPTSKEAQNKIEAAGGKVESGKRP